MGPAQEDGGRGGGRVPWAPSPACQGQLSTRHSSRKEGPDLSQTEMQEVFPGPCLLASSPLHLLSLAIWHRGPAVAPHSQAGYFFRETPLGQKLLYPKLGGGSAEAPEGSVMEELLSNVQAPSRAK